MILFEKYLTSFKNYKQKKNIYYNEMFATVIV